MDGLIVRLYESQRRRGEVLLQAGFALRSAWRTDLVEGNETALPVEGTTIQLEIKPFEIITLRLQVS